MIHVLHAHFSLVISPPWTTKARVRYLPIHGLIGAEFKKVVRRKVFRFLFKRLRFITSFEIVDGTAIHEYFSGLCTPKQSALGGGSRTTAYVLHQSNQGDEMTYQLCSAGNRRDSWAHHQNFGASPRSSLRLHHMQQSGVPRSITLGLLHDTAWRG